METPGSGFVTLPLTSEESSSYAPSSLLTASHPSTALESPSQFQYVSEKQQSRILSPHPALLTRKPSFLTRGPDILSHGKSPHPFSRMYAVVHGSSGSWSRREEVVYGHDGKLSRKNSEVANPNDDGFWNVVARILRPGSRPSKRLLVLIILNVAYSATELLIGLLTRRIGAQF